MHVQDRRKVAFTPGKTELRNVRCPLFKGLCRAKVSVNEVVSYLSYIPLVGMILLFRTFPFETHAVHQTLYPFVVYLNPSIDQFMIDSSNTVAAFVVLENAPDHTGCFFIPSGHSVFFGDLIVVCRSG